jgi:hypothetical protein
MNFKNRKFSPSHGILPLTLLLSLSIQQFGLLAFLMYFFLSVFLIAFSVKIYGKYLIPAGILFICYTSILAFGYSTFKEKISDSFYALEGDVELLKNRLKLQGKVSIFPRIVSTDKPQRLYIKVPNDHEVTLDVPEIGRWRAVSLGHGLHRVDLSLGDKIDEGDIPVNIICNNDIFKETIKIIKPIPNPKWLRLSPNAKTVAVVSENTDHLILINEHDHLTVKTKNGPSDCCFINDDSIAISYRYEPFIEIYNMTTETFEQIKTYTLQHKICHIDKLLAIAIHGEDPGILFFDLNNHKKEFIPLEFSPDWITFGRSRDEIIFSDRKQKLIGQLLFKDEWVLNKSKLLPRPVVSMHHNQGKLFFAATAGVDDWELTFANHYVRNIVIELDLDTWEIIETVNCEIRNNLQSEPGQAISGISPMGIRRGDFFVNVFCGSNELEIKVGGVKQRYTLSSQAPHDAVLMSNRQIIVSSPLTASLDIYKLSEGDLSIEKNIVIDNITEPQKDRINGAVTFYSTTSSSLSCQSCHLHGDSDFSNHDIGNDEFPSTLSLKGLHGTPPFLRNGGYPRLRDLHDVADEIYLGYPLEKDYDRKLALEKWLESNTLPVNPRHIKSDLKKERHGLDIFMKSRCSTCHQLPSFTSLRQYNGSLIFPEYYSETHDTVLDTPSLRGVWNTAPYLLDGRSPTLKDIFNHFNKNDRHGSTGQLSDSEMDALIYFLESL